jgi:hypothetical protein
MKILTMMKTMMNLPDVISKLLQAQNDFNSAAYANCFSGSAVVFDEGKTYKGRSSIKQWIEDANEKYHTVLEPVDFTTAGKPSILTVKASGTFEGSPAKLKFHFELEREAIKSLKVAG